MQKNAIGIRLLVVLSLFSPLVVGTAAMADKRSATSARELDVPPDERTVETLSRGIAAVGVADGRFVALSADTSAKRHAIAGKFDVNGKSREAAFGKLTDQTRQEIFKEGQEPLIYSWSGVDVTTARPIFLDGESLTLYEVDPKTMASIMVRSIPWDLARPPRDRGGEATTPETEELRVRFKQAFRKTTGIRAVGLAPIPDSWGAKGKKREYLMATRIKGFPLALLECDREEPSSCVLARHCRLEGADDLMASGITGIGLRNKDRIVVIGDAKRHRIVTFKFQSCLHVVRHGERSLPGRIPDIKNLAVDGDGRLWVATGRPDDYQNASLFYWPEGSW